MFANKGAPVRGRNSAVTVTPVTHDPHLVTEVGRIAVVACSASQMRAGLTAREAVVWWAPGLTSVQ